MNLLLRTKDSLKKLEMLKSSDNIILTNFQKIILKIQKRTKHQNRIENLLSMAAQKIPENTNFKNANQKMLDSRLNDFFSKAEINFSIPSQLSSKELSLIHI